MNQSLQKEKVTKERGGFDQFYDIADLLTDKLQVNFTNKIDDLNTSYWDFNFKGHKLTLHYNANDGVSICSVRPKSSSVKDEAVIQELLKEIATLQ